MSTQIWAPDPVLDNGPPDIDLCVEEVTFRVHRSVLEQHCDYFRAMFQSRMKETSQDRVVLHCVRAEPFTRLMQAIYSGQVDGSDNLDLMCKLAEVMQMLQVSPELWSKCEGHLRRLTDKRSCFELWWFAEEQGMERVYSHARRFSLAYFMDLWGTPGFTRLTPAQLVTYLSDSDLMVDYEAEVLQALRHWLSFNPQHQAHMSDLLPACVRLKDTEKALAISKSIIMSRDTSEHMGTVSDIFIPRQAAGQMLMFWSSLASVDPRGLCDVLHVCPKAGTKREDNMGVILEEPGMDVGGAVCVSGPYVYLSGGGPGFGKVNWIRKVFRYDTTKETDRWSCVGQLQETRRHHAMLAQGGCLYLFGGFGKFRIKNSQLDCLDVHTGSWSCLPPMPHWETRPVCTAHHFSLYYTDSQWNIYCFNTQTPWADWTHVNRSAPLTSMPARPVALHMMAIDQSEVLVLLSQDEHCQLSVCRMAWTAEPGTMIPGHHDLLDVEGSLRHCVVEAGRLLLVMEETDNEDSVNDNCDDCDADGGCFDENGEKNILFDIMSYDVKEKRLSHWKTLRNVKKAENVVVVQELQKFYRIGNG